MTTGAHRRRDPVTAGLLTAGIVGGLLITVVSLTLAFTRPGFDVTRHGNSMLALGDLGWVQTADFIVYGLLMVAFAVGVKRGTAGAPGGTSAAVCVAVYGLLGSVVVGLNPADPGFGFPPGAPDGYPGADELSVPAKVHGIAGLIGFLAITCGCIAFARYFAHAADRLWALVSAAVGLAVFGVVVYLGLNSGAETTTFNYMPTWVVGTVLWLYIAAVAARLRSRSAAPG
ncbi:DUF998 domain-containing protein [Mycobacterium sp. LTG2003]